jgi:glycosyltransferase involved in cell wall biosynthesis
MFVQEINELHRRGHVVHVVTLYNETDNDSFLDDLTLPKEQVHTALFQSFTDLGGHKVLRQLISEQSIAVVYSTTEEANVVARIVGLLHWKLRVCIRESNVATKKAWKFKVLDVLLNWRAHRIVAVSRGVRQTLVRYQLMYAHKIVVLENAVNIPPKEEVCAKRPEEPVTVLSVGSLTRQKRHDILIRVLVQVREQVTKPVRLVIVGEGAERDRLEQLITELGVSDIVTLTGALQHNEVIAWYRASHIFALASEWEGDPNVVKEAMAQCLPIVATSCTGIKEIIKHGFSGSLCDINDEAGLSRAIGDLLSDKKLRDELGAQAFSFAYERFGIDNHITQLKNVWSAR